MIVITGANGRLGRHVLDELQTKVDPSSIIATARSVEKLEDVAARGIAVRELDYTKPDTIASALDGATQVLLISSTAFGQRFEQHDAVITAAEAAGVEHLAYTSVLRADTNGMWVAGEHKATEERLASSPLTASFLRNGWYIENYTENLAPALEHGALIGAAADGRISAASRADYAAAAATVLADQNRWGGVYELAGPAFTMNELATKVSASAGQEIAYADMPAEAYKGALLGGGLPAELVDFLVDSDLGVARGELEADTSTLAELVGRPLVSVEEAIGAAMRQLA